MSFSSYEHFQPILFSLLSNAPSLTLLIRCSLSFFPSFSTYSPICFNLLQFHINTLTISLVVLLNKLDWMNAVVSLEDCSQYKFIMLCVFMLYVMTAFWTRVEAVKGYWHHHTISMVCDNNVRLIIDICF